MGRRKRAIEKQKKEQARAKDPKKAWKRSAEYKDDTTDPTSKPKDGTYAAKVWKRNHG